MSSGQDKSMASTVLAFTVMSTNCGSGLPGCKLAPKRCNELTVSVVVVTSLQITNAVMVKNTAECIFFFVNSPSFSFGLGSELVGYV